MKIRLLAQVLTGVAIAIGTVVTLNQPSIASDATFSCEKSNGVPTTFAHTQDGKILPMIHWLTGGYFRDPELNPQHRCETVSRRFQSNYDNGTLRYIRAGILNKLPVVCAAAEQNAVCTKKTMLFTLKPGSDANAIARRLFDHRALAAGSTVNQVGGDRSNDPINIDMQAYLYFDPSASK